MISKTISNPIITYSFSFFGGEIRFNLLGNNENTYIKNELENKIARQEQEQIINCF